MAGLRSGLSAPAPAHLAFGQGAQAEQARKHDGDFQYRGYQFHGTYPRVIVRQQAVAR